MTTEPAWLVHARAELGVHETPGPVSTKRILDYRDIAGIHLAGDDGAVSWCAIFVNAMLALAGVKGSGNAMARSFVHWGQALAAPSPGAVIPMASATHPAPSGHVAIATGRWNATYIEVLGGNQGDRVSIARFPRRLVLGMRWPIGVALPAGGAIALPAGPTPTPVNDR